MGVSSVDMSTNFKNFPNAVQKRDMLWRRASSDKELARLAADFEKAGWDSDAIDFFAQIKDFESLKRIQKSFVQSGDAFLFLKVQRWLSDSDFDPAMLETCARNAEAQGKTRYAIRAWERLGNSAEAERLRTSISADGDIQAELASKTFVAENLEELEEVKP